MENKHKYTCRLCNGEFYATEPIGRLKHVCEGCFPKLNIMAQEHQLMIDRFILTKDEFEDLRIGDIVRNKASGEGYIITANYGNRITAVRTVDIINPDEWLLVKAIGLSYKRIEELK